MNVSNPEVDVNILKANHEEADTTVVLHYIYTEAEHIVAVSYTHLTLPTILRV